jgi:acetoin utilization deacetylase AcuC-like enzyme
MALTVFSSSRFEQHLTPPGHPERPARAEILAGVAADCRARGIAVLEPREATDPELERIHDAEYVARVAASTGRTLAFDPDTYTSPQTHEIARLAAGAAIQAVDRVLDGPAGGRALALVRPPGHHAERNRAMGFCFFNNIAAAAAHARARGLSRVAIVDYDVHHGNGTQWAFYDDPSVLFVSSHQYPYYPGTGAAGDIGGKAGTGFTVNLPIEAGATSGDYEALYSSLVVPIVRQFSPQLLLVSAGFDAHADDPLGGMRVSSAQFGRLTAMLAALADECCQGRVVAISEGGYDLAALRTSATAVARVLAGEAALGDFEPPDAVTRRAEATHAAVVPGLRGHWKL